MSSTLLLLLGTGILAGLIAASYAAMLEFHNPFKPKWLELRWTRETITILLIVAGTLDFGIVLRAMVASGVDPLVGITIEIAFVIAAAVLLWKKLHMRERLEAAHRGLSPFAEMRHIRHRERGGANPRRFGSGTASAA